MSSPQQNEDQDDLEDDQEAAASSPILVVVLNFFAATRRRGGFRLGRTLEVEVVPVGHLILMVGDKFDRTVLAKPQWPGSAHVRGTDGRLFGGGFQRLP
jgi:hypothetical protein